VVARRARAAVPQGLGERLGLFDGATQPGQVWIHAVSLGETRAAAPWSTRCGAVPGVQLLLTHGTATGRAAGRALLQPGDTQAWLPYDTPGAVRRFLQRHRPAVGVLMETEVWPNLLLGARAPACPWCWPTPACRSAARPRAGAWRRCWARR
jgi:3-deoxy-D-manno-octulosonic-acid transferase